MEALGQTGSYREHHGMMPLAVRCPAPLDTPCTLTECKKWVCSPSYLLIGNFSLKSKLVSMLSCLLLDCALILRQGFTSAAK